ncbi:MAG TPA: divalent-cation tolerance protein CutA [Rhodocyclaceae bacterium]|nr:MAG: divalent-cation tolerance protein CutA [Betaproteobacteria bacterium CG2_30_68_42]PJA58829.1 MAG: divalent-cation tolerance protein CutA [Rhodocyclales bacterium CG_4_9_14_3_um_filter_68_10]HCX32681.1 divalent-cation tolerance protein CutA [Rhodocyclaceae bacterium]
MKALLVLTTVPDRELAEELARGLVEARLAACVSILAPCQSVYRWEDLIEAASEIPLLIKTTSGRYRAIEQAIRERHPYELPEILAVATDKGLPAYLEWIASETAAETQRP